MCMENLVQKVDRFIEMYEESPIDEVVDGVTEILEECKSAFLQREKEKSSRYSLPCKIGDTVYLIRHFYHEKRIIAGTIYGIYLTHEGKIMIWAYGVGKGELGEAVFLTREEAEEKLREIEAEKQVKTVNADN